MTKEIWKVIEGFGGRYEASNLGRVKSVERKVRSSTHGKHDGFRTIKEKILSPKTKSNGYLELSLTYDTQKARSVYVHRLIALAFIGKIPNGYVVNHKNGIKSDNILHNLEIVTYSENSKHAFENGLSKPPTRFRFDKEKVLEIRETKKTKGLTNKEISVLYNCNIKTIQKITCGKPYNGI